jgi:hypothetical protein
MFPNWSARRIDLTFLNTFFFSINRSAQWRRKGQNKKEYWSI